MMLHVERCLKTIHQKSTCEKCQTVCPSHALNFFTSIPCIDTLKCLECGACMQVCPTDAFESQTLLDETIMASIQSRSSQNEKIIFTCKNIQTLDNAAIALPCLARLDKSMLLYTALTTKQDIHIVHGECTTCSLSLSQSLIETTINAVTMLCSRANLPIKVHLNQQKQSIASREDRQNEQNRQGKIRRRFLLKLLGKESDTQDKTVLRADKALHHYHHLTTQPYVYTKHQRYLTMLKTLFSKKESLLSTIIGTKPIINADDCQQCSICTHVCPSGALSLLQKTSFGILCDPSLCIECHLCEDVCFAHAISQENKTLFDIIENNVNILFQNDFRVNPEKMQTNVVIYRT